MFFLIWILGFPKLLVSSEFLFLFLFFTNISISIGKANILLIMDTKQYIITSLMLEPLRFLPFSSLSVLFCFRKIHSLEYRMIIDYQVQTLSGMRLLHLENSQRDFWTHSSVIWILAGKQIASLEKPNFSISFINVFPFSSCLPLSTDYFLTLYLPPPNGQVQYRHQGNSTGCVPGRAAARGWRWALRAAATCTCVGNAPPDWSPTRVSSAYTQVKGPNTSFC